MRWIKRGCRFQLYRDFYGRLKIKPMGVFAKYRFAPIRKIDK